MRIWLILLGRVGTNIPCCQFRKYIYRKWHMVKEELHKFNSHACWQQTFASNQCWINYMKPYLKRIALKCETRLACSGFDFSAGFQLLPNMFVNFCPYKTQKRLKAWNVQKQWMINGYIFGFPRRKDSLPGFVIITNEMVLGNKCFVKYSTTCSTGIKNNDRKMHCA